MTQPPKVIGIDLSLTATGIASSLGWCQTIGEDGITTRPLDQRLDAIDRLTRDILIAIGGGRGNWPALVAIEIPAFSRSGAGSHERSALWWKVVRSLRRREVPVAEVSIQQRMRYATGKGSASKGAVIDAVARRLPMFATGGDDNCADAAILAAMAADHLGHPLADMPKTHRAALDAVRWPALPAGYGTPTDPAPPATA
jgi:crossover junction endodeoxyribonuclease RuvC